MALPKKKKVRAQDVDLSQPDEFISMTQKMGDYAQQNRRAMVLGFLAFMAVVVLVVGFNEWSHRSAIRRTQAFGEMVTVLAAPIGSDPDATPAGDDAPAAGAEAASPAVSDVDQGLTYTSTSERAEATLAAVAELKDGSPLSNLSLLARARAELNLGKAAVAAKTYEEFLASGVKPRFHLFGIQGLIVARMDDGDLDGALAAVDRLEKLQEGAYKDLAGYRRGRILELKGDKAAAQKAYQGVVDGYPGSTVLGRVQKRLGLLGG